MSAGGRPPGALRVGLDGQALIGQIPHGVAQESSRAVGPEKHGGQAGGELEEDDSQGEDVRLGAENLEGRLRGGVADGADRIDL